MATKKHNDDEQISDDEVIGLDVQDFVELVKQIDYGKANVRLSKKVTQLIAAVNDTGLAGTLTVKFNIKKENNAAIVSIDATSKIPEHPISGSLFFFGEGGTLHREDPRQLRLRELDEPKLRTVEFPTASNKEKN